MAAAAAHGSPLALGLQRLRGAYAWQSLIDAGALVVGGSDAPVEVGSPLIEFYVVKFELKVALELVVSLLMDLKDLHLLLPMMKELKTAYVYLTKIL